MNNPGKPCFLIRCEAGVYKFPPLPEAVIGIFNDGGLIPHTRKILGTDR